MIVSDAGVMWDTALRLLHVGFPASKMYIRDASDLTMDNVYGFISQIEPSFERRDTDIFSASEIILREFSNSLGVVDCRAVIIPDLGNKLATPVVCHAKSLIERLNENYQLQAGSDPEPLDLASGLDVLIFLENRPLLFLADHDDKYVTMRG
jgi:hypothetical protein